MKSGIGQLAASVALALGLAVAVPNAASAAALFFDDYFETITVSACDFEGGASVDGIPMGFCGVGAGGSITVPETAAPVTFTGSWIDLGLSGAGSRTVYFIELGGTDEISDIFHYTWSTDGFFGTITASLLSTDGLGILPPGVDPGDVFVECPIDLHGCDPVMHFSLPFLSGGVLSIPEPGTLALLALSLVGIGAMRRKQ